MRNELLDGNVNCLECHTYVDPLDIHPECLPRPEAVCLCCVCGAVAKFNEFMALEKMSPEEWEMIQHTPVWLEIFRIRSAVRN